MYDVTGAHLLTLAPVIWPARILSFRADVQVHGMMLDLSLQPLDGVTKVAVGAPWTATNVLIADDGRFAASFGTQPVPQEAYPLLADPFLSVSDFVLNCAMTSSDGFCGSIAGYAQVYGSEPSDRIRLEGSTFGAVRIAGPELPTPVASCSLP